jgi:DNA-binding CsgD family transcriptional regulator/tetratricopeptide (TPR) repeat protein
MDEAQTGRGGVVAICGEPGIGKTRLARAAADAASARGFMTVWGRCHEGQYVPPFWPWKQVMRELLEVSRHSSLRSIFKTYAGTIAEILPETRPLDGVARNERPPAADDLRVRLFEAFTGIVSHLSARVPVLVILDNLHCADEPSLQLLGLLSQELTDRKLLIAIAYRDAAVPGMVQFQDILSSIASHGSFTRIRLDGLGEDGVRSYLRAFVSPEPAEALVKAVFRRTEGNPLFVAEVVRLLNYEGLLTGASWDPPQTWEINIPEEVRLAILGLFRNLSPPCRNSLAVAALVGREFDSTILRDLIPADSERLPALLDEAILQGLIEEAAGPAGRYRFAHALIHEAIEKEVRAPRRALLHRNIAEALERCYRTDPESYAGELARHFDAAGPESFAKAMHYHQIAGESALEACAFEDALAEFTRASSLGKGKASIQEKAQIHSGLSQAQHGMGTFREAAENIVRAFDLFVECGDTSAAYRLMEQPYILCDRGLGMTRLLEDALSIVGPESWEADRLGSHYALSLYHDTGDFESASRIFQRALESAQKRGDHTVEGRTLARWANACNEQLLFRRSCEMAERAARLAADQRDPWVEAYARQTHVIALLSLGRLQEASEGALELLELARRIHSRLWLSDAMDLCAAVSRGRADLEEALRQSAEALALGLTRCDRMWVPTTQASIAYELGDSRQGAESVKKVLASKAAEAPYDAHLSYPVIALLMPYLAWLTGEPLAPESAKAAVEAGTSVQGLLPSEAATVTIGLGLIAVLRNDAESAKSCYAHLLPYQGFVVPEHLGISVDHVLAVLAHTKGDWQSAREHFELAVSFCRSSGMKLELALTCRDFAGFLLAEGPLRDPDRGRALLLEASAIADSSGMTNMRIRLSAMLDQAGFAKKKTPPRPDSLTAREVDVLRLLAEGSSNEEIGRRLFISPYTVANHLKNIMDKTGSANRTDAAVYAVRHGLADQRPVP